MCWANDMPGAGKPTIRDSLISGFEISEFEARISGNGLNSIGFLFTECVEC